MRIPFLILVKSINHKTHVLGTKAGDSQECDALDGVLTSGRQTPLLIGSIKPSIGHTEPASCLCSVVKVNITYGTLVTDSLE